MKRASLNDIAKALGVSKTLVSLVLNGKHKEHRIGEETRNNVIETARKMGYKPNQLAQSLRTGRSNTIGLVVADIANPFFARLARSIENEAVLNQYHVIFASSDENTQKTEELIKIMLERQVDGLIICPSAGDEVLVQQLLTRKIPFVLVDRYFPGIETHKVIVDNEQASFNAIDRLIQQDIKKIGHITFNLELAHMKQRLQGYKNALSKNQLVYQDELVKVITFANMREEVHLAVEALLAPRLGVDAIFFSNNQLGLLGLDNLLQLGVRIPEDVSIICFDDHDAFRLMDHSISVIKQPVEALGQKAAHLLIENLNGKGDNETLQEVLLETALVERGLAR
ncbi:LacI family DNA-binding transcriptional regulator [Fulvivirgaceae bacterium BMA10]|uniref:LacI family DNA-binding transcriptional regulator n=1 Tax=Splendidivirga corallicola TaxID=3051826 RepID=A0ABT8KJR7_9BACT|nr:LacI family DNA-binding transcriptional regulator [Fulvivirgaceae bacterium BMA10]